MGKIIFFSCCEKEKISLLQATFKILKTVDLEILKELGSSHLESPYFWKKKSRLQ